jgi:uncharacterized protein YeaC (DUF1315 family)
MASTTALLARGTAASTAASLDPHINEIYTDMVSAVNTGAVYELNGVVLTDNQRDTFIALGYNVFYHNNAYTISWLKPV